MKRIFTFKFYEGKEPLGLLFTLPVEARNTQEAWPKFLSLIEYREVFINEIIESISLSP